jgi:hypothetical protein
MEHEIIAEEVLTAGTVKSAQAYRLETVKEKWLAAGLFIVGILIIAVILL